MSSVLQLLLISVASSTNVAMLQVLLKTYLVTQPVPFSCEVMFFNMYRGAKKMKWEMLKQFDFGSRVAWGCKFITVCFFLKFLLMNEASG